MYHEDWKIVQMKWPIYEFAPFQMDYAGDITVFSFVIDWIFGE